MNINEINIVVRLLGITDLDLNALQKFNRYQVTNRVVYKEDEQRRSGKFMNLLYGTYNPSKLESMIKMLDGLNLC